MVEKHEIYRGNLHSLLKPFNNNTTTAAHKQPIKSNKLFNDSLSVLNVSCHFFLFSRLLISRQRCEFVLLIHKKHIQLH